MREVKRGAVIGRVRIDTDSAVHPNPTFLPGQIRIRNNQVGSNLFML
jgi:hypothetical protein